MRNAVLAPHAEDDIPVLTLFKRFAMIAIVLTLAVVTIWMLLVPVPALANDGWYNRGGSSGQVCRDYTRTLFFEYGRTRTSHGTACLRDDGNWYVVRESDSRPPANNYGTSDRGYYNGPARVTFRGNQLSDRGWVYYGDDWEDLDEWQRHGRRSFHHDWHGHGHRFNK